MQSLKCAVITLRRDGVRIKPSEWPLAVVGSLVSARTPKMTRVDLWANLDTAGQRIMMTLFEPRFVDVVDEGFVLSGHEMRTMAIDGEDRMVESRQLWMVSPIAEPDSS
jgi:hypothetical protein